MSQLTRALFNEFRPFFSLLDDPFEFSVPTSNNSRRTFNDPFVFQVAQPALNLSEEDGAYVIEAEVPGVKRENLDVRVGDGGRSLTIEGKVVRGGRQAPDTTPAADQQASSQTPAPPAEGQSTAVSKKDSSDNQVGQYTPSYSSGIRTFTRTIWLPQPINPADVRARLEDGILTVRAGRANLNSVSISVE